MQPREKAHEHDLVKKTQNLIQGTFLEFLHINYSFPQVACLVTAGKSGGITEANTCLGVAGANKCSEQGKRLHEETVQLLCFTKEKILPEEKDFTPYFAPNVCLLLSQSLESNFLEMVTTL